MTRTRGNGIGFIKTMLAVWLALVLANAFDEARKQHTTTPISDNGDRTFCISVEGFTK